MVSRYIEKDFSINQATQFYIGISANVKYSLDSDSESTRPILLS